MILIDGKPCLRFDNTIHTRYGFPFFGKSELLTRELLFYLLKPYEPIQSIGYVNYHNEVQIRVDVTRKSGHVERFYLNLTNEFYDEHKKLIGARIRLRLIFEIGQIVFKWQDDLLVLKRWAKSIGIPECLQKHIGLHIDCVEPNEQFQISRNHFLLCCFSEDDNLDDVIVERLLNE